MEKKDRQAAGDNFAQENAEKSNNLPCAMKMRELKSLYYLKKEVKELRRRISELETAAAGCTARITGLPGDEGISDKIGEYAAQIADLRALLELNLKKCFFELNRLNRYIQSVEDPLVKQIMIYRFINGCSWRKIAFQVGGNNSVDSVKKRLYRYLKNK